MATQVDPIRITRAGLVSVADLVVRTEADNEGALATIESLMGSRRTPEEDALLDVLTVKSKSLKAKLILDSATIQHRTK